MFILSFLKCALLSLVTLIVCVFLGTWCSDQAVKTKNKFVEAICWSIGTFIGIAPAYLIPLICCYLY